MTKPNSTLRRRTLNVILAVAAIATALPAAADVRLPRVFTDDMMLQRDKPVRVWGWAEAGEVVTVALSGKSAATKADASGAWKVELPALKEGDNLELTVKGKNSVTLKNIIVGDIWVCSGQSNMEWTLAQSLGAAEDIKAADLPKIRQIKFRQTKSDQPETDAPTATPWQVCAPGTVGGFTAAGFYFAREIQQKTGVPIGLVYTNWGGTRIEPWTAAEGLEMVEALRPEIAGKLEAMKTYQAQLSEALTDMENWIAQSRKNLAAGIKVTPPPAMPALPSGKGDWSSMYNAMIHPIVPMPIKGALWYQGESNGPEGETYFQKMQALIGGWRKNWGQGDFPFYFVQLANYQAPTEDAAGGNGWAKLREAQLKTLALPNTGMAVIIDTVPLAQAPDIHPKNKYDVGARLAQWALARDYAQKGVVASGPLFQALKIDGSKAHLSFDYTGGGLIVGKKDGRNPATEAKDEKLKRFAIAGEDKKWFWAEAVIEGSTVVVSSPDVKAPVAVRYAFEMNPDGANLYNRAGLPASPFRTDSW